MRLTLLLAGLLALIAGCSSGMYSVSGTVTYDGKPLRAGVISFQADGPPQDQRPNAGATITDGKYALASGERISPGPYVVRISPKSLGSGNENNPDEINFPTFVTKIAIPLRDSVQNFDIPAAQR
jgi:hypothetical protein